jgi:hypothetical protein
MIGTDDHPDPRNGVAAPLRDLLGHGADHELRHRVRVGSQTGNICAACGRSLTVADTVYRRRIFAGASAISARRVYWVAPVCVACRCPCGQEVRHRKGCGKDWCIAARWATISARPCAGCGRGVVNCCSSSRIRITACSDRCRRRAWARRRIVQRSGVPCVHCRRMFSPTRADAKYCSSACRQRAYRARRGVRHAGRRSSVTPDAKSGRHGSLSGSCAHDGMAAADVTHAPFHRFRSRGTSTS